MTKPDKSLAAMSVEARRAYWRKQKRLSTLARKREAKQSVDPELSVSHEVMIYLQQGRTEILKLVKAGQLKDLDKTHLCLLLALKSLES